MRALSLAVLVLVACGPAAPVIDGGVDAGQDAGIDAGTDAGADAGELTRCWRDDADPLGSVPYETSCDGGATVACCGTAAGSSNLVISVCQCSGKLAPPFALCADVPGVCAGLVSQPHPSLRNGRFNGSCPPGCF